MNLKSTTPLIEFLPEAAGFIIKTDLLSGEFSALKTAYEIVRQMTISSNPINLDYSILEFLLTDLNSILKRQGRITKASESIIKQLNKKYSSENTLGFDLASKFWHFVDILWLYLFFFLYFFN